MKLELIKQPGSECGVRYASDKRFNGNIHEGYNGRRNKNHLRVKVHGCSEDHDILFVEASCVTKDPPHEPHVYRLGGENCYNGKYVAPVNPTTMIAAFPKMNILYITKAKLAINKHENSCTRYEGSKTDSPINLRSFRLEFRLLRGLDYIPNCPPIVSRVITNIRYRRSNTNSPIHVTTSMQEFKHVKEPNGGSLCPTIMSRVITNKRLQVTSSSFEIEKLVPKSCSIKGNEEVIIICSSPIQNEKNIIVKIYETPELDNVVQKNGILWESSGENICVYPEYTVYFIAPKYTGPSQMNKPIKVWVQLHQTNNSLASNLISFQYIPIKPLQIHGNEIREVQDHASFSSECCREYHQPVQQKNSSFNMNGNEGLQTRNGTSQNTILHLNTSNSDYRQPNISTWQDCVVNNPNNRVISENMLIKHNMMMACDTFDHTGLQEENVTSEQNNNIGSNALSSICSYNPSNEEENELENFGNNNNSYLNNFSPLDIEMCQVLSNDFPIENITDEDIFVATGETTECHNYIGNDNRDCTTFSTLYAEISNYGSTSENMETENELITSRSAFDATNYQLPPCSTILHSASNSQGKVKWNGDVKRPFRQRGC